MLDFGLAKLDVRADPDEEDLTSAPTVRDEPTQEGAVLGTVGYMSPEQVRGRAVDHRTDIFAFGCLLYEAATRRRPFEAESRVEVMHKILRDEPAPIEQLSPGAPGALRRLIKRCLAKEPERRFQSMMDLALELADLVEEYDSLSPASPSAVSSDRMAPPAAGEASDARRRWRAALAVLGVAALIAAGVWLRGDGSAPESGGEPQPESAAPELRMRELTTTADVALVAISPGGDYLAQARWRPAGTGLWITHIATGSSVEVVAPEGGLDLRGVTFTPDGNYLVFVRNHPDRPLYSTAYQVPVLGGEARPLLNDIDTAPAFSPDGRRVAFVRGATHIGKMFLVVANADGGDETVLAESAEPSWFRFVAPAWSPDGESVLVIQDVDTGVAQRIVVVDAATGEILDRPVSRARFTDITEIAWMPDGRVVLLTGRLGVGREQLWAVETAGGAVRRLTNDLSGYEGVTVTADGRQVVARHETYISRLWIAAADSPDELTALTTNPRDQVDEVAVAGDGHIFFERLDPSGSHIWRVARDGGDAVQLTREGDWFSPMVSVDGSTLLAIRRDTDVGRQLWRLDPRSGRQIERFLPEATNVWQAALAPDASWLTASLDESRLLLQPLDGGEVRILAEDSRGGPWVSPDGSLIAYRRFRREEDGTGTMLMQVLTPDGEPRGSIEVGRITANDGWFAGFDPSGEAIIAFQFVGGEANLWSLPLDGSPWVQLTDFGHGLTGTIGDAAWSPDGEWLVLSKGEYWSDAVLIEGLH